LARTPTIWSSRFLKVLLNTTESAPKKLRLTTSMHAIKQLAYCGPNPRSVPYSRHWNFLHRPAPIVFDFEAVVERAEPGWRELNVDSAT
jgi:hypothetical protein